jgi:hypothetical protein
MKAQRTLVRRSLRAMCTLAESVDALRPISPTVVQVCLARCDVRVVAHSHRRHRPIVLRRIVTANAVPSCLSTSRRTVGRVREGTHALRGARRLVASRTRRRARVDHDPLTATHLLLEVGGWLSSGIHAVAVALWSVQAHGPQEPHL